MTTTTPQDVARMRAGKKEDYLEFYCPGCRDLHAVPLSQWLFNQSLTAPTLNPSIHMTQRRPEGDRICHAFLNDGQMDYCADSNHDLAGKTAQLPPIEQYGQDDAQIRLVTVDPTKRKPTTG